MEVAVALDFLHAVRGANDTPPHQPATNLDDVLPFLQLVNGAYQSAGGISSFVPDQVSRVGEGAPEAFYAVSGLNSQFDAFERDPSQAPPHLACDKTRWLAISALGSSQ